MYDTGDIDNLDSDPPTATLLDWDDEMPVLAVWRAVRALGLPLDVIDPR